ncbi:MAG: hypothetical protein GY820_23695 [Gammaproteobacteria bacterium]|nr:hypothetical protein [Gammaproteobacteria bacterium]
MDFTQKQIDNCINSFSFDNQHQKDCALRLLSTLDETRNALWSNFKYQMELVDFYHSIIQEKVDFINDLEKRRIFTTEQINLKFPLFPDPQLVIDTENMGVDEVDK